MAPTASSAHAATPAHVFVRTSIAPQRRPDCAGLCHANPGKSGERPLAPPACQNGGAMDLDLGARWHHPVRRPAGSGRMGAQLGVARAVAGLLTTAWLGIVAHQLTINQFGQVTLVLSPGALVSIGTDLGIPLALAKVACDHPNSGPADRWWVAGMYSISVAVTPLGGSFLALLRGRAYRPWSTWWPT
jgi:hypothetical protein